jgi:prophage regulatory protein
MRALTLTDVMAKIGGGKTFVYAAMNAGTFPKPIRVGRRSSWIEAEIDQWLTDRISERDRGATIADAITQRAKNAAAARQAAKAAQL